MALQIGDKAPAFTLHNTEKQAVNSKDFDDKNLLVLFFPLAFTGVCTKELCTVRDDIGNYENVNSAVVGVSVDSLFVLEKFKGEQNIGFPLLSDFNKTAATDFGVLYDEFPAFGMKGVAKRAAFIVDKSGIVQYAEVCPTPGDLPNFEAITSKLKELS